MEFIVAQSENLFSVVGAIINHEKPNLGNYQKNISGNILTTLFSNEKPPGYFNDFITYYTG